jgi:hypothetical protein
MPWDAKSFAATSRICSKCRGEKSNEDFSGKHYWCKECVNIAKRNKRASDPAYAERERAASKRHYKGYRQNYLSTNRAYRLRTKYGIDEVGYQALLIAQGGKCALCKCEEPGGRGRWHVDHDHVTGKVRGLLCLNCNVNLGAFEKLKKIVGLEKIEEYIGAVVCEDVQSEA